VCSATVLDLVTASARMAFHDLARNGVHDAVAIARWRRGEAFGGFAARLPRSVRQVRSEAAQKRPAGSRGGARDVSWWFAP
jgi:hypothetical protein